MTRIVGIDPGRNGAIAVLDTADWTLGVIDMPLEAARKGKEMVSAKGVIDAIKAARADAAFLELVTASPQMGTVSAFSFGDGFGTTRTAILAFEVPLWLVRPQDWKGATKTPKDKKEATTRAAQLFPAAHKVFYGPRGGAFDGRAEACLLAFYGCLTLKQPPTRPIQVIDFPL